MRVAAAGLIALPVVVGGLGIAAAVVILGPPDATTPTGDEAVGEIASPGSGETISRGGTAIEGSRPHLTVRDGTPTVIMAGTIPGFLALLPASANPLPTLATFTSATAEPGGPGTGPRTGPAPVPAPVGSPTPTVKNPSPAPDSPYNSATTKDSPAGGTVDGGPIRATAVGGPALLTTGTAAERDTNDYAAVRPPANRPPPPHAAGTGRPDHAGTTGPPPHASADPRSDGALRDSARSATRSSPE
ncbi:MAG: hypothetical protein ACK40Z_13020 [Dietzia sp.]